MHELSHPILNHINFKTLTEVKTEFKKIAGRMVYDGSGQNSTMGASFDGFYYPNRILTEIENIDLSFYRVIYPGQPAGRVATADIGLLKYSEWYVGSKYVSIDPNWRPYGGVLRLIAPEHIIIYWFKTIARAIINGVVQPPNKWTGKKNPIIGNYGGWLFTIANQQLRIPSSVYNREVNELIKAYKVLSKS